MIRVGSALLAAAAVAAVGAASVQPSQDQLTMFHSAWKLADAVESACDDAVPMPEMRGGAVLASCLGKPLQGAEMDSQMALMKVNALTNTPAIGAAYDAEDPQLMMYHLMEVGKRQGEFGFAVRHVVAAQRAAMMALRKSMSKVAGAIIGEGKPDLVENAVNQVKIGAAEFKNALPKVDEAYTAGIEAINNMHSKLHGALEVLPIGSEDYNMTKDAYDAYTSVVGFVQDFRESSHRIADAFTYHAGLVMQLTAGPGRSADQIAHYVDDVKYPPAFFNPDSNGEIEIDESGQVLGGDLYLDTSKLVRAVRRRFKGLMEVDED